MEILRPKRGKQIEKKKKTHAANGESVGACARLRVPAVSPPPSLPISPGAPPPPWPLTNQSAEPPLGPREGERRRETGRERCARRGGGGGGEGHVCTQCRAPRLSSSSKSLWRTAPPSFSEPASERRPEKLGNELRRRRRVPELKTTPGRRFRGFEAARALLFAFFCSVLFCFVFGRAFVK